MPCIDISVNVIFTPCKHRAYVQRNFTRSVKADALCLMPLTKLQIKMQQIIDVSSQIKQVMDSEKQF